jgi:hypothetical protein
MAAVVDRVLDDEEIEDLKNGRGKTLYVYGTATYEDIYHTAHKTNFCMGLVWLKDGNFMGVYTKRHNDAD